MSSAHRPTWDPAQGKAARGNSRIYSVRDMAAHTRLKFRQPGQGSTTEVERRDLKAELLAAEREAAERKAQGQSGFVPDQKLLMLENQQKQTELDQVEQKRRKVLQQAVANNIDADDDDDDDDDGEAQRDSDNDNDQDAEATTRPDKGKGKAVDNGTNGQDNDDDDDDDDDDDSDSDDDEDETAELLRELEKIKRERAEEKERLERERLESEQVDREEEIAMGNPLLNLQAALGRTPSASSTTSTSTSFGVKRRWDDDVIFKNQSMKDDKPKPEFVNDLLRTNYHRKFIKRFIA
ncbi:complexed with cef1p [Microbotryomycetes sp. JL221]|nr:complexed with cef1p [Microbotryomycetes sp. JL221]